MSELIIYPHGKRPASEMNEKAIRRFADQIAMRIREASITKSEREDMRRLIEREVRLVFVDQKYRAEDRIRYWEKRKLDPATAAFMNEQVINMNLAKAEQYQHMVGYLNSRVPPGHQFTAAQTVMLNQNMVPENGTSQDMVTFMAWVDHLFIPQLMRDAREAEARAAAVEQSRKESIAKANESLKRPVSEW